MQKPDPYGNWVIGKIQQETAGNPGPLPEEVITAARAAGLVPRLMPHVNLGETVQVENPRLSPQTFGKQYCGLSQKRFREGRTGFIRRGL